MSAHESHIRTIQLDIAHKKKQQAEVIGGGYLWRKIQEQIDDLEEALHRRLKAQREEK